MKVSLDRILRTTHKDFHSIELDVEELRRLVDEFVGEQYPDDSVQDINVVDDGVVVILSNGDSFEIDVDWNEFLLR